MLCPGLLCVLCAVQGSGDVAACYVQVWCVCCAGQWWSGSLLCPGMVCVLCAVQGSGGVAACYVQVWCMYCVLCKARLISDGPQHVGAILI
jgi:hypothetical protein